METEIQLKPNDVFKFHYNSDMMKGTSRSFMYHCFDGQLIVQENGLLKDTYWGNSNDMSKCFTLEKALAEGHLDFICNLNDIEEIQEYETDYYNDNDLFNLSSQHGYCKLFAKRKGAKKNSEKMKGKVEDKIRELEAKVKSAEWEIGRLHQCLTFIQDGDLEKVMI